MLPILKFIRNFIDENPLICCYDEISTIKKLLGDDDEIKLKQKYSCIGLKIKKQLYYFKAKIDVPDNYPVACIKYVPMMTKDINKKFIFLFNNCFVCRLGDVDTNFPPLFTRHFTGQGRELARQCVEPPLRKKSHTPFIPSPSLEVVTSFLIQYVYLSMFMLYRYHSYSYLIFSFCELYHLDV